MVDVKLSFEDSDAEITVGKRDTYCIFENYNGLHICESPFPTTHGAKQIVEFVADSHQLTKVMTVRRMNDFLTFRVEQSGYTAQYRGREYTSGERFDVDTSMRTEISIFGSPGMRRQNQKLTGMVVSGCDSAPNHDIIPDELKENPELFKKFVEFRKEKRAEKQRQKKKLGLDGHGGVDGKPEGVVSDASFSGKNATYHIVGIKHNSADAEKLSTYLEQEFGHVGLVCVESPEASNRMSEYYGSKAFAEGIGSRFECIDVRTWQVKQEDKPVLENWGEHTDIDMRFDNPIKDYRTSFDGMKMNDLAETQLDKAEQIIGKDFDSKPGFDELMAEYPEFRRNTIHTSQGTKSTESSNTRETGMASTIIEHIHSTGGVNEVVVVVGTAHAIPSGIRSAIRTLENKYDM